MKNINIFIAGSKNISIYREGLILWSNGKNYTYRDKDRDCQINMYSFKEVGDDQDVYNAVITEKTDIILFVVEGSIGEKTKEELQKAKEGFHQKGHPEIWVFMHQAETNAVNYLEGALGRKYAVDFESVEDLINKVNVRMDNYLDRTGHQKKNAQRLPSKTSTWTRWASLVLTGLVCLLAGLGIGKCFEETEADEIKVESPMLLIAGGGSVANFIEERPGTLIPALADYPNGYFLHLPTKSAWKMLVEEVVSLQDTRRYYPICLSATEATDSDFCSAQISQQMFLDSAIVVSCKLGEDSLTVYAQKDCKFLKENAECLYTKHITAEQLKTLIESKEMNVYTTSFESGTRAGYCQVLNIDNYKLNEYLAGQFSEFSPESSVSKDSKSYLLLGSQYYQMKSVRDDVVRLTVDVKYAKPMLIYFMAYRLSQDIYKIPKVTIEFIHRLQVSSLDEYISSDGTIKIRNHDHVVYSQEDLVKNASK